MKPFFLLIISLFVPSIVLGSNFGLNEAAQKSGLVAAGANATAGGLSEFIGQIIGTALSLIAIVFFILVLYGGITWMTARGNEEQTKKALNTITAAIIGLILIMASYAITSFVFDSITGQNSNIVDQSGANNDANSGSYCCQCESGNISINLNETQLGVSDYCRAQCAQAGRGAYTSNFQIRTLEDITRCNANTINATAPNGGAVTGPTRSCRWVLVGSPDDPGSSVGVNLSSFSSPSGGSGSTNENVTQEVCQSTCASFNTSGSRVQNCYWGGNRISI